MTEGEGEAMVTIDQLDLECLPIASQEFGDDPDPFMAAARMRHPWLAATDIGYLVTSYQAIDDILRLDDRLTMPGEEIVNIMGTHGTGWGDFAVEQMLVDSGARHERLRGAVSAAFRPGNVKRMRALMRETVIQICDEWLPKGAFDFTEFAAQFPIRVMFALIGTSPEKLPEIVHSLEIHRESFNLEVEKMGIIEAGYQTLWRFVDEVITEREPEAQNGDLLDDMIAANSRGQRQGTTPAPDITIRGRIRHDQEPLHPADALNAAKPGHLPALRRGLRVLPQGGERADALCHAVEHHAQRYRNLRLPRRRNPCGHHARLSAVDLGARSVGLCRPSPLRSRARRKEADAGLRSRDAHLPWAVSRYRQCRRGVPRDRRRLQEPRRTGEVEWKLFPGVWGVTRLPIAFNASARA